jgi:hypothetical protein
MIPILGTGPLGRPPLAVALSVWIPREMRSQNDRLTALHAGREIVRRPAWQAGRWFSARGEAL